MLVGDPKREAHKARFAVMRIRIGLALSHIAPTLLREWISRHGSRVDPLPPRRETQLFFFPSSSVKPTNFSPPTGTQATPTFRSLQSNSPQLPFITSGQRGCLCLPVALYIAGLPGFPQGLLTIHLKVSNETPAKRWYGSLRLAY